MSRFLGLVFQYVEMLLRKVLTTWIAAMNGGQCTPWAKVGRATSVLGTSMCFLSARSDIVTRISIVSVRPERYEMRWMKVIAVYDGLENDVAGT